MKRLDFHVHFNTTDPELIERFVAECRRRSTIAAIEMLRDLFAWADIEAVQTTYTIAGGDKASTAAELLIGKGVALAPAAAQASLF